MSNYDNLTPQDRADVACQLDRVEDEYGDHQPTEFLALQQLLWRLGFAAGTIALTLAVAERIASGGW